MNKQHKRRIKLIRPSLQLRLIGAFGAVCGLALLTQALVLGVLLTRTATALPTDSAILAQSVPSILITAALVSVALVLPALMLIGTRVTFRVAGPLHRMERHLEAVARGERPGRCSIRQTDHLQEFCGKLNAALEVAAASTDGARERDSVVAAQPRERAAA